jgi:hypothetical protein
MFHPHQLQNPPKPYNTQRPQSYDLQALAIADAYSPTFASSYASRWTVITFTLWIISALVSLWQN